MPVTRKVVAQTDSDGFVLKIDHDSRYIQMDSADWQMLFGPNSSLTTSSQVLKLAAEFNKTTFDSIRFAGYLYSPRNGSVDAAAGVTFNVYLVNSPNWQEQYVATFPGTLTPNSYFFADIAATALAPIDFYGGDTIMVEAVATRLSETYRDRLYVNHLGIFYNAFQLQQAVDYLDITKVDE